MCCLKNLISNPSDFWATLIFGNILEIVYQIIYKFECRSFQSIFYIRVSFFFLFIFSN